jgi:transcriptional regulator with XRE-family HTH domain
MENAVGQRLKEARKFINFSQKELADAVGVTQSAISLAEKDGSISNELAIYISTTHNINLNWLFAGIGNMTFSNNPNKDHEDEIMRLQTQVEEDQDQVLMLVRELKKRDGGTEKKAG